MFAKLTLFQVGSFLYERQSINENNVISTKTDFAEGNWANVDLAKYDLTPEIKEQPL